MSNLEQRFHAAQVEFAPKIRTAARNSSYVSPDHDIEDMEQELLVVLWECCALYDPEKGASFNYLFWMRAKQKISKLRSRARMQKRTAIVVSLDAQDFRGEKVAPSAEEEFLALERVRERGTGVTAWYLEQMVESYGAAAG